MVAVVVGALLLWRRRPSEPDSPPSPAAQTRPPAESAVRPATAGVRREGGPHDRGQPFLPRSAQGLHRAGPTVLVARDPGTRKDPGAKPTDTSMQQKYCTGCGMGLSPAHSFCGYCGKSVKT
ncbi:hypothetical protein ACFQX6_25325 [Streptosporangium lutulentum]